MNFMKCAFFVAIWEETPNYHDYEPGISGDRLSLDYHTHYYRVSKNVLYRVSEKY